MSTTCYSWQQVWREGFAPGFSTPGLQALEKALLTDDERLLQGATCSPPPLQCVQDWPVEAACAVSYPGWQGDGLAIVADVEEAFAQACRDCDERMNEPAGARHFLNWFDDTPRDQMRAELLREVRRTLELRGVAATEAAA